MSTDPALIALFADALSKQARGDTGAALFAYRRVQRQFPDFPDAWTNASTLLREMGRAEDALAAAERAVGLDGGSPVSIYALASARIGLGQVDAAEASLLGLLGADPSHLQGLIALAGLYGDQARFRESRPLYDRAIAMEPDNAPLLAKRGIVRMQELDLPGAEADFRAAIGLGMDENTVRSLLAWSLQLQGRYREAWTWYRPGMSLATMFERYDTGNPRWGGGPLQGRTLLVRTHRHGFGDVIMLARFMPQLKEMSRARVLLSVYEPILRLLEGLAGIDGLVVQERDSPPFDAVINLFELPMLLDMDSAALPPPINVRGPDDAPLPELERSGFKIGLVWAGNPIHAMDAQRSLDPRLLDALADVQGAGQIAWYGLQVPPSQEPPRLPGFIDMSPRMGDFLDTARIVGRLDLVVAVDTSTLHLAGSLGAPTVAMLTHLPEWRWGLGEATAWYPSVRLIRQPARGDWKGAVEALKAEIDARLRSG